MPLRVRIVAIATIVVAAVLALTAVGVVIEVRRQYLDDLDRSLRQRAEQILAAHEALPEQALVDSNAEDRFAQVVDHLGAVVASTPNIDATAPLAPPPSEATVVTDRDDLPLEDDAYRVLTMAGPNGGYVIVGENVDDVHDDVRVLMATLALAFPLAVVALGGAMWWLVGRTLRPVELIRSEVAGIGLDDLHRRVDVPRSGDEIALLASTMNDMLARLDRSVAQQRTLVADASHELRTPLTRLRTELEVDLATADPTAELASACRGALAEVISMQQLVDDLLFLARRDAREPGRDGPHDALVDLDVVIEEQVRLVRERSEPGCRIGTTAVSPVVVTGRPGELGRVISNLLSNAVRHAAGVVTVSLTEEGDRAVLTVDDDGPGIPLAERERVFGRFVRLDRSRTSTAGGTGLGLAIVRDVVAAHGGTVVLDDSPTHGTRAIVTLPLASPHDGSAVGRTEP